MGIIKLVRAADSFTRIPNATAQDQNLIAEALSVIVFLSSLPENWIIRESHVRRRFKWGRCRMKKVWDNLEKYGYVQRLHRQRLEKGRIGTQTSLAVFPYFLTGSTKPDTGDSDSALAEAGKVDSLKRKNKQKPMKEKLKQTTAKRGEKLTVSITDAENLIGVRFPNSICQLKDPGRIITILLKYKLEPEQIRILFSQFDDYCSNSDIKDSWALLIDFVKRANRNKLHLTSNAEANLTPWI